MNEVRIGVTGTNDSGRALNTARTDVKALGDEAQKTTRRVVELDAAERGAERGAKGMAAGLDDAGDQAGQLARKLLEAAAAAKVLDAAGTKHVNRDDGSGLLGALVKEAPRAGAKAGTEAAGTFASAWQGGVMASLKALPPQAQAALGAAIGVAVMSTMPFLVSAINGAILGGVGAGGLAAGIMIQAKDPQVAGAFKQLGGRIMHDLTEDTKPFKAQLLDTADGFGKSWAKIQPNIQGFFEKLAPAAGKLGQAISRSMEILGPALERAAGPAEKVLNAVADEIPEIAGALGSMLDSISKHGESAAEAIKFILFNVEILITGFDLLVQSIGPVADGIVKIGMALGLIDPLPLEGTAHALDTAGGSASTAAGSFDRMSGAVYNTADAADQANEAFNRLFGELMGLDEANLKVAEDFRVLSSTLKKNKDSIDANTEGGQANRRMILGMIGDLEQKREAEIAAGNGTIEATRKANAAYLSQLEKLRAVAVAAGQPTAAIDRLIAKYKQLAGLPDITKNINIIHTATYRTNGTPQAGFSRYPGEAHGGIVGAVAANGGQRNGLTKVGESGWEYVELPPGSRVYPHGESMRMQGAGGGGGGPVSLTLSVQGSTGDWLYEMINKGINDGKIVIRQSKLRAA
jgi:hypothetical protein